MELFSQLCQENSLMEAWQRVRQKNARGGVDGISPEELGTRIPNIIKDLSEKLTQGRYTPTPYHQIMVPKFNEANEWRSLSLPVVVDKIVQQAFVNLTGPIFEKDFLDCSYAYRTGKGAVKAIQRVEHILKQFRPKWTINFDIDNFFDSLNHDCLKKELEKKIEEKPMLSLVQQWLQSGYISQKGDYTEPEEGIPQGAVVSPLLSNIYLHPLDVFAVEKGYPYVRYSDNFITFQTTKEQAYVCYEELKSFLEEKLLLKLNENPEPFKHVKTGFTFLGIFFGIGERKISRSKEAKSFKKLNWLTDSWQQNEPEVILKRLNEHITSQKRFYGFINPEAQFALFDDHLIKRLQRLLAVLHGKDFLTTKEEKIQFLKRLDFYRNRDDKAKETLSQNHRRSRWLD